MLHLIQVSFDQYDLSNVGGYQDVSQEILNLVFFYVHIFIINSQWTLWWIICSKFNYICFC
jgi:hypothetical protein